MASTIFVTVDDVCLVGDDFDGDFFFFPFTWVHPSSLLGWSLVSGFGSVSVVFVVVVVVAVVAFVVSVAVILVVAVVVF